MQQKLGPVYTKETHSFPGTHAWIDTFSVAQANDSAQRSTITTTGCTTPCVRTFYSGIGGEGVKARGEKFSVCSVSTEAVCAADTLDHRATNAELELARRLTGFESRTERDTHTHTHTAEDPVAQSKRAKERWTHRYTKREGERDCVCTSVYVCVFVEM